MIFDKTIKGLKKALTGKAKSYKDRSDGKQETYSLYGFLYTFQVWMYEIVSSLTEHVVTSMNDNAVLQILRWFCFHSPTFAMLCKEVFASDVARVTLELVTTEKDVQFMNRGMELPRAPLPSHLHSTPPPPPADDMSINETRCENVENGKTNDMVEGVGTTFETTDRVCKKYKCRCNELHDVDGIENGNKELNGRMKSVALWTPIYEVFDTVYGMRYGRNSCLLDNLSMVDT